MEWVSETLLLCAFNPRSLDELDGLSVTSLGSILYELFGTKEWPGIAFLIWPWVPNRTPSEHHQPH